jgi:hypothetical protein
MKALLAIPLLSLILFHSCGMSVSYTFADIDIPAEAKTFSVAYFPNKADLVMPTLSQTFTEALIDKFLSETSLDLTESDGDLNFEGEIIRYSTAPRAITGDDVAALNRLTIAVKVSYTNELEPEKSFEKTFRQYADYESSQSLSDVEGDLVEEIVEKLVEDIFNEAVVNW